MTVVQLEFPCEPLTIGCYSDLHIDSPSHDRKAMLADLDRGAEMNARMFIAGDLFTAIMPSDKRSSGAHRRGQTDALIDQLVDQAAEVLMPYRDNIDVIGLGNHEVTALLYDYTDLVNRLRCRLQEKRAKSLPHIRHGGYTGFILLRFASGKTRSVREIWYWHHGSGGASPVTRGMIDLNRVIAGNRADVYWLGHKHTNVSDTPRVREINKVSGLVMRTVLPFFTAGYDGAESEDRYEETGYVADWPRERFYQPQSQGCAFVLYRPKVENDGRITLARDILRRA
jgi:hypothetical protein